MSELINELYSNSAIKLIVKTVIIAVITCTFLNCKQKNSYRLESRNSAVDIKVPDFLEESFSGTFKFATPNDSTVSFARTKIGELIISEGQIIACDPFLYNKNPPFTTKFPIGNYPVELAIATFDDDERVGFARIKFSDHEPAQWQMAVTAFQDLKKLSEGDYYGYPVDAGTGCFMDISGAKELENSYAKDFNYFETLTEQMEKTYKHTRSWLLWEHGGKTVAMFSSGFGDGSYGTYIGYDKSGNICRLVTDFGILPWE